MSRGGCIYSKGLIEAFRGVVQLEKIRDRKNLTAKSEANCNFVPWEPQLPVSLKDNSLTTGVYYQVY